MRTRKKAGGGMDVKTAAEIVLMVLTLFCFSKSSAEEAKGINHTDGWRADEWSVLGDLCGLIVIIMSLA